MKTINKLLARWGYKVVLANAEAEQTLLQLKYSELEVERDSLREQIAELKRRLAARTSGEWYWRKQAKSAREVIE
jgi:chaperonin cofactor prefoldin